MLEFTTKIIFLRLARKSRHAAAASNGFCGTIIASFYLEFAAENRHLKPMGLMADCN